MRTNTEGPINYFIESYKLTGALPDTRYDIGWEFEAYPGVVFTGENFFIQTNEDGNGYFNFKATPDQMREGMYPATSAQWNYVFVSGGTPVYLPAYGVWVIYGGPRAFETEVIEFHYDWDW
ncbi:MAG: hypothetical protein JSV77_09440 [Dehalococcoidales bacterium]|nr:MAG: hypothetical protein JSV77_09440 [Dehalococcoidales bacterium]